MRRVVPARLLAVALAAGSLTAIPMSAPSSAAASPSCTKLVSPPPVTVNKVLISKSTVSGCTPVSATGGSGKSVTTIGKTITSKTTWAGGKGTTTETVKYTASKSKGKCPKASASRVISTGTVTGGTGAALKAIPKGAKVTATVCVAKNSSATLEPGTKYVF